jgi:hypothetical protein
LGAPKLKPPPKLVDVCPGVVAEALLFPNRLGVPPVAPEAGAAAPVLGVACAVFAPKRPPAEAPPVAAGVAPDPKRVDGLLAAGVDPGVPPVDAPRFPNRDGALFSPPAFAVAPRAGVEDAVDLGVLLPLVAPKLNPPAGLLPPPSEN